MRAPVRAGDPFFIFCRPDVFDDARFKAGHVLVYTQAEMDSFDTSFEQQLSYNFSERRATSKKQAAADNRASRSSVLMDLDHNVTAHSVSSNDFRDLS